MSLPPPPDLPPPPLPEPPVLPPPPVEPWRVRDAVIAFVGGLAASIAALLVLGDPDELSVAQVWGIVVPMQTVGTVAVLAILAPRRPPWRRALAIGFRPIDLVGIPIGIGLQLVVGWIFYVIVEVLEVDLPTQEVVQDAESAVGSLEHLLVFVGAVILAPVMEEIVFRGVLLRSLLPRGRTMAIVVSGVVFGLIHLIDPNAWVAVPFLAGLGIVLGYQTVRTGRIGMAIMTHAGFNLVTTVVVLFAD